jgi:hypothetical protein
LNLSALPNKILGPTLGKTPINILNICNIYLVVLFIADTQADILLGGPNSAICVQGLDDSQNSAIHMIYHSLLCPSSIGEPRYPMLKAVFFLRNICQKDYFFYTFLASQRMY